MVLRTRFSRRAAGLLVLGVLMLPLLLAACGGSDDSDDSDMEQATTDMPAEEAAIDGDEARAEFANSTSSGAGEAPAADMASNQIALDRLAIRSAQITLIVDDTLGATGSVRNLALTKGGFVFSSSTYTEEDRQYAQLTLRVPAERFDETISDLRTAPYVTEVKREESSSQDVSSEFIDNESRLLALEETQRRYMVLLSEANTVEEILRLESELTDIRSQIETIKGRQNYLTEMTSFSTITVTLHPEDAPEEEPDDGIGVAKVFDSAWDRSIGALAGIAEAVIVLAIFTAFFLPLSIGVYYLYRTARKVTARIAE